MTRSAELMRLDAVTPSYGGSAAPFDRAMRGYMMRSFEPFFRDGPCLQVGCAHGEQTNLLLERFEDVTVLEPTAEFLALAQAQIGDRATFVCELVETFATERRFETIIFTHVLEHVADPVDALARLAALLTPSGRIYVAVPNAEALSRRIAVKMGVLSHLEALSAADVTAGHRRCYRLDTLCRDVVGAGLACEHTGGIFLKPLANFQFDALIGSPLLSEAFMEGCFLLGREDAAACASIYAVAGRRADRDQTPPPPAARAGELGRARPAP